MSHICPCCGNETETLHEGYCQECCKANQNALDEHNAEYDAWLQMTDYEREAAIHRAQDMA